MLVTVFKMESFLLFVEFDITWMSLQNIHQKMKMSYLIFDTLHWEPLLSDGLVFWSCFRLIDGKSFWSYEIQVDVVLACCIIHNHIMGVDPYNFLLEEICSESEPIRRTINLSQREEREENREWITKREMIASTIWNDYNTHRN